MAETTVADLLQKIRDWYDIFFFFNKASCLFIPVHSKYKFMDPLMFNLGGLIITNQEQVVSAVAGLKCTPSVYTLLISCHLLEVDHSFTLQLSPGYGREKRKRYLAETADFESSSLQVSYSPARKRHWYDDTKRFSPLQFMGFLYIYRIKFGSWFLTQPRS